MPTELKYLIKDDWLSCELGRGVFRVEISDDFDQINSTRLIEELDVADMAYSKVNVNSIDKVSIVEKAGLNLVDTAVVLEKNIKKKAEEYIKNNEVETAFARDEDCEEVVKISSESFEHSRFHKDPFISKQDADRIKADWAGNFFAGKRGDWLITARVDGQIEGFCLLVKTNEKTAGIDLMAVSNCCRRRGLAKNMISFVEKELPDLQRITVGTQISNYPALNCYLSSGFSVYNGLYIFHYHKVN